MLIATLAPRPRMARLWQNGFPLRFTRLASRIPPRSKFSCTYLAKPDMAPPPRRDRPARGPPDVRADTVRFLLDHDVPDDAGFSLEALGHIVVKLREVLPVTTPDDEVLRLAGERAGKGVSLFPLRLNRESSTLVPVAATQEAAAGIVDDTRMRLAPTVCSGLVCFTGRGQNAGANASP